MSTRPAEIFLDCNVLKTYNMAIIKNRGELYLLATKDTVKDISLYASGLFIGFTDKIYEALKDFEA